MTLGETHSLISKMLGIAHIFESCKIELQVNKERNQTKVRSRIEDAHREVIDLLTENTPIGIKDLPETDEKRLMMQQLRELRDYLLDFTTHGKAEQVQTMHIMEARTRIRHIEQELRAEPWIKKRVLLRESSFPALLQLLENQGWYLKMDRDDRRRLQNAVSRGLKKAQTTALEKAGLPVHEIKKDGYWNVEEYFAGQKSA